MNGKIIVSEDDGGSSDEKRVQTIGEKKIRRDALHKVAKDINDHSSKLGSVKKEDKVAVKDKVLKSIEKLTSFSKRVSGRDKKPKVLESIEKVMEKAKKVGNGEEEVHKFTKDEGLDKDLKDEAENSEKKPKKAPLFKKSLMK